MTRHPFDPTPQALPERVPIFPLTGALLLPGGRLPLNIFELRYLNMVADAMGEGRYIGMIQPRVTDTDVESPIGEDVPVYPVGCMGRIVSFQETDDGRFVISLRGLIRFTVGEELPVEKGYRRVEPDFSAFLDDLEDHDDKFSRAAGPGAGATEEATENWVDRARLIGCVKNYFESQDVSADWKSIERTPDAVLVTTLAMVCPFAPGDQQALLESRTTGLRAKMLIGLIESELAGEGSDRPSRH